MSEVLKSSTEWAVGSSLRPSRQQFAEFGIAARGRSPAGTGLPRPKDQAIGGHVVENGGNVATAVAPGIFQLDADLTERLAFPCHRCRRQTPMGIAGHARWVEVGCAVTCRTGHAG